jgi:glucose-6-phosphate 1-dehydrogenase
MTATQEPNPLVEGLEHLPVGPTTMVIFGVTGDLGQRKLLPALYNLAHDGSLPARFNLVGFARRERDPDEFREHAADAIREHSRQEPKEDVLSALLDRIHYIWGGFDDDDAFKSLEKQLEELDDEGNDGPLNRLFYLATAPSFFGPIAQKLDHWGMTSIDDAEVRIVVEKPIGHDLESALELNATLLDVFDEHQIFRIDHYLGKETVQNMLAFRFANAIFEPVWNRNYVDHVEITAAEDLGVGTRAGYYDSSGALRDLVQNHMLQLMALLAMEPPLSFSADSVRDEKAKVLGAVAPPEAEHVDDMAVRARYTEGRIDGKEVPGYLEEEDVPEDSETETYVALRLGIDNWRWSGVPFYLRTGKRLARKVTEIAVHLRPVPHLAFTAEGAVGPQSNTLVFTIQPNEGVSLALNAKIPGTRMRVRPVNMEFTYGTSFMSQSPEAYERLVMDAMRGDATLFTRDDEVEALWRIVDPILKGWADSDRPPFEYPAGSAGPEEADDLLYGDAEWRRL